MDFAMSCSKVLEELVNTGESAGRSEDMRKLDEADYKKVLDEYYKINEQLSGELKKSKELDGELHALLLRKQTMDDMVADAKDRFDMDEKKAMALEKKREEVMKKSWKDKKKSYEKKQNTIAACTEERAKLERESIRAAVEKTKDNIEVLQHMAAAGRERLAKKQQDFRSEQFLDGVFVKDFEKRFGTLEENKRKLKQYQERCDHLKEMLGKK